jgi:hypothetical protein
LWEPLEAIEEGISIGLELSDKWEALDAQREGAYDAATERYPTPKS